MRTATHSVRAVLLLGVVAACGGQTFGGSSDGVGDPCVPFREREAAFNDFDERELNLETQSPSCKTAICLINHFRGRVSCPYGQDAAGRPPEGKSACVTNPGGATLTGAADPRKGKMVRPQCVDRTATAAVYC